jgi:hypothetical protein
MATDAPTFVSCLVLQLAMSIIVARPEAEEEANGILTTLINR